jgi:hypothetical protein
VTTTAPVGLDAEQRSTLERLVIRARSLLEEDLAAQAEGRFGIHLDGTIEDEAALPDDTTDKVTRRDLEQIVDHLRSLGEDPAGAVARLLREASFTHLNRLVAIRIAEAIELLPESLAKGPQSQGFKDVGEIMPMLAGDYRAYVRLCGDELAADAPALFDPRNPLLALEPSTAAFEGLITLMASPDAGGIWSAPDTLGWAYQFFNTADERREMRESSAPRDSRELAVRNQFFTPRYVVDFLVQNSLGRRLIESDPSSPLLDELPLLVDPPTAPGPTLELADVKCLDPACGSGHFLLGCYDLLERAWELAGTTAAESAPMIVAALWGVDIDPRCAQVASAAITLRARRHCRELVLPRPNIITARGLPSDATALPSDLELTSAQRALIDRVGEVLASAPVLGVLLKAEEALDQEIRHGVFGGVAHKPGMLELSDEAAEATERELLAHLQAVADEASSSVVERLLAAEADDALRLVDAVRQRYDVVLMNPPFGEPVPDTKPYLRASYPWMPSTSDLFSVFVGRGVELCNESGYLGAITSRAGMFLKTCEKWRREVLLGHRLVALADFGYGVMEQALVEAAAYVVGASSPDAGQHATFIRLLRESNRPAALQDAIYSARRGDPDKRVFTLDLDDIHVVPGSPVAYWMAPGVRRLFKDHHVLEGSAAEVRHGLSTGDDFRFVRTAWEVDPRRIARSRQDTRAGRPWVPFGKGGEYSPYWADVHLVLDWTNDGAVMRDAGATVRNDKYYFRPGLSWPRRTASGFAPRIFPEGAIFSEKGDVIFPRPDLEFSLLAWLNTSVVQAAMAALVAAGDEVTSGGAAKSYEMGLVQKLPWVDLDGSDGKASSLAQQVAGWRAESDEGDEVCRRFVAPAVLSVWPSGVPLADAVRTATARAVERHLRILDATLEIEQLAELRLAFDVDTKNYIDGEIGRHPAAYDRGPIDEERFARLYQTSIDAVIDEIVAEKGGARAVANLNFFADRRLEVLAHGFERPPQQLAELRDRLELLPPDEPNSSANEVLSYLVGVAMGRWDVRIGRDPGKAPSRPALFAPAPLCAPGMLVGADGFPAAATPEGYPLELPPLGILVDEPGHPWDVEAQVVRAASALFDHPEQAIADLLHAASRRDLREYLRRQFFRDHVSKYSKSRRKAPVYWPLTVPSKAWGVWAYAPMLTREGLYAIASAAGRRERLAGEAIARLQREQQEGASGSSTRRVVEELDAEEKLMEELRRFRAEAERIAGLGWEPNLDDGAVLCAAPLADLFPSWPDAKLSRAELRKGKHKWSTVAGWADQL